MRKLFSLLGIDNNSERPTRESAVEMIAGSPDEIAGVFETARQEIAKLKDDKDQTLVTSEFKLKPDVWHWMMLEIFGDQMAAQVSGGPVLKARHPRIDVPKDQINLPTRGGGIIFYDDVRVWKALPTSPSKE